VVRYTASNIASAKGGRGLADDSEHGKLSRGIKRAVDVTRARAGKLADTAEWVFGRRAARVLGVVALFAVVVTLLMVFLNLYVGPTKPGEKKDLVLALAQILGGTALLSGLYFTWRTLQVNREGQITDRFTRAIDQLGATDDKGNKLHEIRLGGIYALERIARESEEDHWPIMEVLTAYVRQHAPWRPQEGPQGEEDAAGEKFEEDSGVSGQEPERTKIPAPAPDIRAIMTVLRRRTRSAGQGEPERLDLHGTNLSGADLWKANLRHADLHGTNLSEAFLTEADLSKASLSGANLSGAYLSEADLSGADLSETDLSEAMLDEVTFSQRILQKPNLSKAILRDADLSGAFLLEPNLSEADLSGANLSDASFLEADLSKANLWGANLWGANLSDADLSDARGELTGEQIEAANGNEGTKLPSHLKPPAHWGVKTDEPGEGD